MNCLIVCLEYIKENTTNKYPMIVIVIAAVVIVIIVISRSNVVSSSRVYAIV